MPLLWIMDANQEGEQKTRMNEEKRFSWLTSHTSSQFYALHGWHDCNYHQSILEMLMQEMHKQSIIYQEVWNA